MRTPSSSKYKRIHRGKVVRFCGAPEKRGPTDRTISGERYMLAPRISSCALRKRGPLYSFFHCVYIRPLLPLSPSGRLLPTAPAAQFSFSFSFAELSHRAAYYCARATGCAESVAQPLFRVRLFTAKFYSYT